MSYGILNMIGTAAGLLLTGFWCCMVALSYPFFRSQGVLFCQRRWGRSVLCAARIRVAMRGVDEIDPDKPYIYVSNHQSGLDVLVLIGFLPQYVSFVAKKELLKVPFIGWALKLGDHVMIDRSDRNQSYATLEAAAAQVSSGKSVVVFPEGTRSPRHELRPFKRGTFLLARAAQVPIVPVGIVGSADLMRARELYARSGVVGLRIGAPIAPEDFAEDDFELAEQVRADVAKLAGPSASRVLEARQRANSSHRDTPNHNHADPEGEASIGRSVTKNERFDMGEKRA